MLSRRITRRSSLGLLAAGIGLWPALAHADPWSTDDRPTSTWVATTAEAASVRTRPDLNAPRLRFLRLGSLLRVVDAVGPWKQVFDPHFGDSGYIHEALIAEADEPSRYVFTPELPLEVELATVAIATSDTQLFYAPTPDPLAQAMPLQASDREALVGATTGDDGGPWYRTSDGYYLPADGLFITSAARSFSGRWLEVSLTGLARVVARDEGTVLRSFNAIKGTAQYPTPPGTWAIVRRVANETMDSSTVGIPRNGPGGYYLKDVLYTQYFRGTGESLHYNWWSSAWGLPGSHGCLGLSLAEATWLWGWATIGTPVLIHA